MKAFLFLLVSTTLLPFCKAQLNKLNETSFDNVENRIAKYGKITDQHSRVSSDVFASDIYQSLEQDEVVLYANEQMVYSVVADCNNASCNLLIRKYIRQAENITLYKQRKLQGRHSLNFFPESGNMVSFEEDRIIFFDSGLNILRYYKPFDVGIKASPNSFNYNQLLVLAVPQGNSSSPQLLLFEDGLGLKLSKELNDLNGSHVSKVYLNNNSAFISTYQEKVPDKFKIHSYTTNGNLSWSTKVERPISNWVSMEYLITTDRNHVSHISLETGEITSKKSIEDFHKVLGVTGKLFISDVSSLKNGTYAILFREQFQYENGNSTLLILDSRTSDIKELINLGNSNSDFRIDLSDSILNVFNTERKISYEIK